MPREKLVQSVDAETPREAESSSTACTITFATHTIDATGGDAMGSVAPANATVCGVVRWWLQPSGPWQYNHGVLVVVPSPQNGGAWKLRFAAMPGSSPPYRLFVFAADEDGTPAVHIEDF